MTEVWLLSPALVVLFIASVAIWGPMGIVWVLGFVLVQVVIIGVGIALAIALGVID